MSRFDTCCFQRQQAEDAKDKTNPVARMSLFIRDVLTIQRIDREGRNLAHGCRGTDSISLDDA
jgi:hypothetical protein